MALLEKFDSNDDSTVESVTDDNSSSGADGVSAGDPVATLAAGSVLYSWYHFYVNGDHEKGIFVGLWAPTLLAAADYLQHKQLIRKLKKGLQSF
jgi:hypothetical protein